MLYCDSCVGMQSACLQFINALICYPDDIDFRIHLRNEFVRHGLLEGLEVVGCSFLVISSRAG